MDLIERATIIHYHRHRLAQFGEAAVAALGWRTEESQRRRFEVIAGAADFSDCRVLDLGCGTGDLKPFLDERFPGVDYLGVDQVPEFISLARARHGGRPGAQFEEGNCFGTMLPRADHVLTCGALNYRSADPEFLSRAIRHMFAATARSLIFNVLDAAAFPEHPLLVGRDIPALEAFCLTLTPRVRLIRGYAPDDATFVLQPP